jgi:hypothetical protein
MSARALTLLSLALSSACATAPKALEVSLSQRAAASRGEFAGYAFAVREGCKLSLRETNKPVHAGAGDPAECSALLEKASRPETIESLRAAAARCQATEGSGAGITLQLSSGELLSASALCLAGPGAELLKQTHQIYEKRAADLRGDDPPGSECDAAECRSDADVRTGIESPTCPDGSPAPHSQRCVRVSRTSCVWEGCQALPGK